MVPGNGQKITKKRCERRRDWFTSAFTSANGSAAPDPAPADLSPVRLRPGLHCRNPNSLELSIYVPYKFDQCVVFSCIRLYISPVMCEPACVFS